LQGSKVEKPGVIRQGIQLKDVESIKDFLRPNMVSITSCKNVLLEGVTFQNSPAWCLHPLLCDQITLKNLTVRNPWYGQNGDGVDLESCSNAVIESCTFDVGDDGICIKSGRDEEGRKRGRPTENVVIKDCIVYHGHGGFVIGSEMSGGVRNMFVSNCTFMGTDIGLRFKTNRDRGGVVENIHISDIKMTNIVGEAILFDMYYAAKDPVPLSKDDIVTPDLKAYPVTEATPQFKSFYIKNVICKGAKRGIFIQGLPEMNIKDIHLENVHIEAEQGMTCIEGENIHLKNVTLLAEDKTTISIQNCKKVNLEAITYSPETDLLLNVSGKRTTDIILKNTDLSKAKKEVEFASDVSKGVLIRK
jgi:DNA sulfur modification protein DndE